MAEWRPTFSKVASSSRADVTSTMTAPGTTTMPLVSFLISSLACLTYTDTHTLPFSLGTDAAGQAQARSDNAPLAIHLPYADYQRLFQASEVRRNVTVVSSTDDALVA